VGTALRERAAVRASRSTKIYKTANLPVKEPLAMLKLTGVSKIYGEGPTRVEALRGVDLNVNPGEFLSIMGPSGSGKSTLLNLVSALDVPTTGRIEIDGQDTSRLDDNALTLFRRRRIGLIFQFFNLLPALSALENVMLPVMLERKPNTDDKTRGLKLLAEVGLAPRTNHRMHELSGGEMQRVAIARSLMLAPRLLLADEPTGNLDSSTGAAVLELLRTTCHNNKTAIVMVTHDRNAAAVGDRLIVLKDGRVVSDEHAKSISGTMRVM
jgi:putative ABC transport system ATP-binding protein